MNCAGKRLEKRLSSCIAEAMDNRIPYEIGAREEAVSPYPAWIAGRTSNDLRRGNSSVGAVYTCNRDESQSLEITREAPGLATCYNVRTKPSNAAALR